MNIVYLIVKNLDGIIDNSIVPLINERGNCGKVINEGDKWQDLKDGFQMRVGEPGRGGLIIRYKNSIEHWILPFETHPQMEQPSEPNDAFVLTAEQYRSYEWDIIEEE